MIDLTGLPPELLAQLRLVPRNETEKTSNIRAILTVETMSLDEILIAYYRKHNVVLDRKKLANTLDRLRRKGMVEHRGRGGWGIKP